MKTTLQAILFAVLAMSATPATAQELDTPSLKWPTTIYLAAAAADWSTHNYCLDKSQFCGEGNPMYAGLGRRTVATTIVGASVNVAAAWAVNRWVKPRHPRLAAIGLIGAASVQGITAAQNIRFAQRLTSCAAPVPAACH